MRDVICERIFRSVRTFLTIKHEYLRCLSLSSPAGDISIKSWTIEILVLTYWIPAFKNFFCQNCVREIFHIALYTAT